MSNVNVAVPKEFIEKYMPHANPYFVKVYLYALAQKREDDTLLVDVAHFAGTLNMLATDIDLAIHYWQSVHIIEILKDHTDPLKFTIKILPCGNNPSSSDSVFSENKENCDSSLGQQIASSKELKTMLLLAQNILGKPLSPSDTEILFSLYDWLNLPIDVILMLLEYCASIDNTKMSFIEKTAIKWHDLGLNNVRAAQSYVNELGKKDHYMNEIKQLLTISKPLTVTEKKHLSLWHDTYHSNMDMISLAYEYCLAQIGKTSIPYMSAILKSWYEQGMTSVEEARQNNNLYKTKTSSLAANTSSAYKEHYICQSVDYDYDEISKLAAKKLKNFAKKDNR